MRALAIVAAGLLVTGCGGGGSSPTPAPTPTPTPTSANAAPIVARANADQSATVGTGFSYDVLQGNATFSDPDGDALTIAVSLSTPANGLTVSGTQVSGSPSATGSVTVTVTATDPGGLRVSDSFVITIGTASGNAPNILVIIADDMGQDSSAQYALSTDLPATPRLNALAASGIVFENAWVNPVCSPTRGAMLSGRYGLRTGVLAVNDPFPASETILHAFLEQSTASSAYSSALIGKWHLGGGQDGPGNAGIDHFAGIIGGGVQDYTNWTLNVNGVTQSTSTYATTEITNQAISWVGAQSGPWFMWVAYNAPHTPFHLPPANLHNRNLSGTQADIDANPRPYYLAAIEAMDSEIGRLLDALPAATRNNTVILFIGDNGTPRQVRDASVFPAGVKGTLYEGGVRVPMIVSGAGVTRVGERESALINGTDFYATIAELAGQTRPSIGDSRSFKDLLSSAGTGARSSIYSEFDGQQTVRNARYKLIETTSGGAREFYDLQSDPTESSNLINSSTISAPLAELEAALAAVRNGTN